MEWYAGGSLVLWWVVVMCCSGALLLFNLRFSYRQFRLAWVNGVFIPVLLFALGALLCWYRYPANGRHHLLKYYHAGDAVTVTIEEPLTEKEKSFKTIASVEEVSDARATHAVTGTLILYFRKDSAIRSLGYGDQLVFATPLQSIRNTGDFDYRRYAAMQGIYRQAYLRAGDFIVLPGKNTNGFKRWLLHTRETITGILRRHIPGRQEAGLAEALLIGYKDDLDKTLLQSYTNTGVVHIIAISGLHVGLIYWLLSLLIQPLTMGGLNVQKLRWCKTAIILTGLWLFALLAGGGPSVLRSALMFSCMVVGEQFFTKTSIYNTLAASAFILLCIDPFWCWDVGFQLSYIAVLSIVVFMKPIYGWLAFQNKLLDGMWKLNAVTLAAQVLTVPLTIYHFHRFPNYFLITNLVAVPLSTLIVLEEIILCVLALVPLTAPAAGFAGRVLQGSIRAMNLFIDHMERMPLASWNGLQINVLQLVFLYAAITGLACWLMIKSHTGLLAALCSVLGFGIIRMVSLYPGA